PNSHLFISLKIVGASFLYIEQGPAEAAAEIRSIFDHYSEELKSPDLYWTCVQAKSDLGHFLLEAGRYSEAIKELEDALSVETRPLTRYFIYFLIGFAALCFVVPGKRQKEPLNAIPSRKITSSPGGSLPLHHPPPL